MKLSLILFYTILLLSLISAAKPKKKHGKPKKPQRSKSRTAKIGGGQFPDYLRDVGFVVGFVRLYENFHQYFCAGTILNDYWVITSITCARNMSQEEILLGKAVVRAGTLWIEGSGGFDHLIAGETHDVYHSLIEVKDPFIHFPYENRVPLVSSPIYRYNVSSDAEVFGWGESVYQGTTSETLNVATVQLMSNDDCYQTFPDIGDDLICAQSSSAYFCDSDAGAPLIQDNVLIAVALFPAGHCHTRGVPGVYMRIAEFIHIIVEKVHGLHFSPPRPIAGKALGSSYDLKF